MCLYAAARSIRCTACGRPIYCHRTAVFGSPLRRQHTCSNAFVSTHSTAASRKLFPLLKTGNIWYDLKNTIRIDTTCHVQDTIERAMPHAAHNAPDQVFRLRQDSKQQEAGLRPKGCLLLVHPRVISPEDDPRHISSFIINIKKTGDYGETI